MRSSIARVCTVFLVPAGWIRWGGGVSGVQFSLENGAPPGNHPDPALTVAGIVEDFNTQNVVEFYSESGADCITKAVWCCGLFDPKTDGLEGRWSCDLTDMMKPHHGTFYMLATSRRIIVDYEFRWVKEWEDDNYYVG